MLHLAPGEETAHDAGVGAAGVGIGDPGAEELIGGKEGVAAGALEHGRDRSVRIEGPRGGQQGGLSRRLIHGDLANDNNLCYFIFSPSVPWQPSKRPHGSAGLAMR